MNNVLIFTIIVALLVSFVAFPVASGDSGLHGGWVNGEGHTNFPGQGLGEGHPKHGCSADCPICGGNPHIPPCEGPGDGGF
jgi:hypothetical protein